MAYNRKDYFFKKAKKENFVARSIFKLEEIDQKFKLIKPGNLVLDLGAAPGSWSQYLVKKISLKGRLLGIDLQQIELSFPNATFICADLRDLNIENVFLEHGFKPPFDVVVSDMAPRTTGIRITDQARSLELSQLALDLAIRFLKKGGHFVVKLFQSEDFELFRGQMRAVFSKVEILRPESTRKESKEIFLIGISKKS